MSKLGRRDFLAKATAGLMAFPLLINGRPIDEIPADELPEGLVVKNENQPGPGKWAEPTKKPEEVYARVTVQTKDQTFTFDARSVNVNMTTDTTRFSGENNFMQDTVFCGDTTVTLEAILAQSIIKPHQY